MERHLLEAADLDGFLLVRHKLELSAAFLIPHLLQLALSCDLRVRNPKATALAR